MQTFRIIAKNPSHENAASKLVPAAVRFFVLAKFVRSKQHSALLYETAVLLFSPLSTRGYARAWTAVCMQEEKAAVSEEDPGGIHRGKYFEQGVFV